MCVCVLTVQCILLAGGKGCQVRSRDEKCWGGGGGEGIRLWAKIAVL